MILDGRPLKGKELDQLKEFLGRQEVEYDPEAEYTVCLLNDSYEIEAAGSVCGLRSEITEEGMDDMLEEEQKCSILCNLLIENKKIQELIPADIRNRLLCTSQKCMYEIRFKE